MSGGTGTTIRFANEDEIESDALLSDDDDEVVAVGEPDADFDIDLDDEDYYGQFVQSLRADGIDVPELVAALGDESDDEDENYEPDDASSLSDEEDEDYSFVEDEDEDDFASDGGGRVNGKEVRDLLSDCLLAVNDDFTVGGFTASGFEGYSALFPLDASNGGTTTVVSASSTGNGSAGSLFAAATGRSAAPTPSQSVPVSVPPAAPVSSSVPLSHSQSVPLSDPQSLSHSQTVPAQSTVGPPSHLYSDAVSSLFAGTSSELCIDRLPLHAIRRVVARQMSMALQLLVQMLLMAKDSQGQCWMNAHTYLVQLSNLREAAVRRAALVQSTVAALRERDGETHAQRARRLTRSQTQSLSRSPSLFDAPLLAHAVPLLQRIDDARTRIHTDSSASLSPANRKALLSLCEKELIWTYAQTPSSGPNTQSIKVWHCLIPQDSYPFDSSYCAAFDASTATGRAHFSPSEEDLLVRGLVRFGEGEREDGSVSSSVTTSNSWQRIQREYLPNKDESLLQFRYTQRASVHSGLQHNDLKRYKSLACSDGGLRLQKFRAGVRLYDDRWSPAEELSLLRAARVFGRRWPLVVLYALPHRPVSEVKAHWADLLRLYQRAINSDESLSLSLSTQTAPGLTDEAVSAFFRDLSLCASVRDMEALAKGGGREARRWRDLQLSDSLASRMAKALEGGLIDEDVLDSDDERTDSRRTSPYPLPMPLSLPVYPAVTAGTPVPPPPQPLYVVPGTQQQVVYVPVSLPLTPQSLPPFNQFVNGTYAQQSSPVYLSLPPDSTPYPAGYFTVPQGYPQPNRPPLPPQTQSTKKRGFQSIH